MTTTDVDADVRRSVSGEPPCCGPESGSPSSDWPCTMLPSTDSSAGSTFVSIFLVGTELAVRRHPRGAQAAA